MALKKVDLSILLISILLLAVMLLNISCGKKENVYERNVKADNFINIVTEIDEKQDKITLPDDGIVEEEENIVEKSSQ